MIEYMWYVSGAIILHVRLVLIAVSYIRINVTIDRLNELDVVMGYRIGRVAQKDMVLGAGGKQSILIVYFNGTFIICSGGGRWNNKSANWFDL